MHIIPNTNMRLLSGVPLNKNYEHTVLFKDVESQRKTFLNYTKHTLTHMTYQRVNNKVCRVNLKADDCYDCNYMMFQNESYGNKWFYAFITKVEYVNNSVCEINFEIDVMQTWLFDYELKECFVEREHSVTDVAGDNILPEPVELGEYVFSDYGKLTSIFDDYYIIVGAMALTNGVIEANVYDNVVQGLTLFAFDISNNMSELRSFLKGYENTPENIVTMYMCPKEIVKVNVSSEEGVPKTVIGGFTGYHNEHVVDTSSFDDFFGNYLPKNNKLLTYPYTYYHVDNNNGSSLQLRFEFFYDREVELCFDGTINIPVQISCRPKNYKNVAGMLNTESITLNNYPLCSWSNDSYTTWVANNLVSTQGKLGTSAISALISAATGNMVGFSASVVSGVHSALNYFIGDYQASIAGDNIRGNYQNGNVNTSHNMQTFYHGQVKITEDYARTIDDYFTKYGYRTCKVKKPNTNSRPHWNYTKTCNCMIVGELPSDDIEKICNIFNSGVTFWKKIGEVGDYSLDNSPS